MRRAPGLLLAALLTLGLAACTGDGDGDDTASDPAPSDQTSSAGPSTPTTTPNPSEEPTVEVGDDGPIPFTEVAILTGTEEDGKASPTPVPLDSEAVLDDFVSQFTGPSLADDVRAAVAGAPDVGPDQTLVGVVVTIGCDRPDDLRVERVDGAVQVLPVLPKNQVQCFAAQTTVAVLVLDTAKLGPIVS